MEWDLLSGPQQKLLKQTIIHAFPKAELFNMFVAGTLGKPVLDSRVGPNGYEIQVFDYLRTVVQAEGWTDKLVDALQAERPENPLVRNLPDALRAVGAGAPNRLSSDMRLERIVSGSGFADLRLWAQRLSVVGEATCRIEAPAWQPLGTGFLVAPDIVLTNYHVLEKQIGGGRPASDVVCRFGYARDTGGTSDGFISSLATGDQWTVKCSPFDPDADVTGVGIPNGIYLDYAFLRLRQPITHCEPLNIDAIADLPETSSPVLIVQHPEGGPQSLALGKSLGVNQNGSRFLYDADTLPGSSGSPVLNQKLQLVALHHAGDPRSGVKGTYNQGIPLISIMRSLEGMPRFWR
ncbi:trypsin-like peptidase domain-containing protein [Sinorhizobium meliloti]|uniref:trypsin-like peptidase domain-containing protein n=1 Tax=Rhizobium meliloti TaxID=382 RepID=UPI003D64B0F8